MFVLAIWQADIVVVNPWSWPMVPVHDWYEAITWSVLLVKYKGLFFIQMAILFVCVWNSVTIRLSHALYKAITWLFSEILSLLAILATCSQLFFPSCRPKFLLTWCSNNMQGFQHSVLHANGKCGFCHVQWPMDNEGQEDYECGRGMLLKPLSFVERLCILIAGNHFATWF